VAVLINKAMIEIPPKFAGKPPVNPEARMDRNLIAREWKGAQGGAYAQSLATLRKTGKPILRGAFKYVSARVRRGIEADLLANYRERVKVYETWVRKEGYAGYIREIGDAIPAKVSVNMNVLGK